MAFTTRLHAVAEAVPMHTQVKFSYQTEAGTLKFEMGKDGQRLLLGKGSFGKVPHCVHSPSQLLSIHCKAVGESLVSCLSTAEKQQLCTH